jgi:hypothetical protein
LKRLPTMSLAVLLATTVAGCDSDPGAQVAQRDVYTGPNALENCVADWGDEALCGKRISEEEVKHLREANAGSGGGGVMPIFLGMPGGGYGVYGPDYGSGARSVSHNGRTFTPTLDRSTQSAGFARTAPGSPRSSLLHGVSTARPPGTVTTSRPVAITRTAGFGSTGRGFSGGGAS